MGAAVGGILAIGMPRSAAGQSTRASAIAVPTVDRLVITNVVDNLYDIHATEGKTGAITVERTSLGAGGVPLLAEHGLAYHLSSERGSDRREILLDFALTDTALFVNYRALGVDPTRADAFILSHGHLDHYGGLPALALAWQGKLKPGVTIYAGGDDTFCRRAVVTPSGAAKDLGQLDRAKLDALGLKTVVVKQPVVVDGHAFTSGQIPRLTAFEQPPAPARLVAGPSDSACAAFIKFPVGTLRVATQPGALVTDTFQGEIATAYHVRDRGLVVIASSAHAGVINSVRQCQRVSGIDRVHAIVGGLHPAAATDEVVAKTAEALRQIDPDYIIPAAHCTGLAAILAVQHGFPKRVVLPSAGTRVIFGG